MLKLGYLGPIGTFSHKAAQIWAEDKFELVPFRPIPRVLEALQNREVDRAIVPLENLLEDVVSPTLDWLIATGGDNGFQITAELLLPIRQMLLGREGTNLKQVCRVVSHYQGLSQCRRLINQHNWETVEVASTAEAAKIVAESPVSDVVAIASPEAGEIYHLKVLQSDVGDSDQNITRFIILGGPAPRPTGDDRTTIFFVTNDEPGALHKALGVFWYQDVNLTKIASRTAKTTLGQCIFWIDANGHRKDSKMQIALEQLQGRFAQRVWVAGSYPKSKLEERR